MSEDHNSDGMDETKRISSVNRRRFVKSLGAVGGTAVFTATVPHVSAKTDSQREKHPSTQAEVEAEIKAQKRVVRPYSSPAAAEQAVEQYGDDLMTLLADKGWLDSSNVSDLKIDDLWCSNLKEYSENPEGVLVDLVGQNDGYTARIEIAKEMSDYKLWIFVKPELQQSHAWINPNSVSDDKILQVTPQMATGTPQLVSHSVMSENESVEPYDFCQKQSMCSYIFCRRANRVDYFKIFDITCCAQADCTTGPSLGCTCAESRCYPNGDPSGDGYVCGNSCEDVDGC